MTIARSRQICFKTTRHYHLVNRCVRRSFMCGYDSRSGKDYSYRKKWIVDLLKLLCEAFGIEVLSYAIMSNHFHIVVYVNLEAIAELTDQELLDRYEKIFNIDALREAWMRDETQESVQQQLDRIRERLSSISWFMKVLSERIARRANKEDECSGHFWQGRYRCQAILDEAALLMMCAYVDLNPMRAKSARSLSQSQYTSIQARISNCQRTSSSDDGATPNDRAYRKARKNRRRRGSRGEPYGSIPLAPVCNKLITDRQYCDLVAELARSQPLDSTDGILSDHARETLRRVGANPDGWLQSLRICKNGLRRAVGHVQKIREYASRVLGVQRCVGEQYCAAMYL